MPYFYADAISDQYIINILHSVSQARIVKVYSFDTSTCYTYYESIQWHPPNPYHLIHCMHSIDHIIWYSVAYLCGKGDIQFPQHQLLSPSMWDICPC
ncbi:hypothetical protein L208DRAFT_1543104 [Tricholoma matsutake]|nr:hypothetical protein L208DRAFT_1543104 [Tricholoma matsutake 945]